jgi:cysteine dioxygenase
MSLEILISNLSKIQNKDQIEEILLNYNSNDWKDYVKINENRYNRCQIYQNDLVDVLILTWSPGQSSGIHDHPNVCFYKVLSGEMTEQVYTKNFEMLCHHELTEGNTGFINNDIGYHNMINNSNNIAVSLHIYSPPKHQTKFF